MKGGSGKEHAVKGTVNNIAQGTCEDKREAGQQTEGGPEAKQKVDVVDQESYGYNAEATEEQFAPAAFAKTKSEGHTIVFHKVDECPIQPKNANIIAVVHVCFYPDFESLIEQQHQRNQGDDFEGLMFQGD